MGTGSRTKILRLICEENLKINVIDREVDKHVAGCYVGYTSLSWPKSLSGALDVNNTHESSRAPDNDLSLSVPRPGTLVPNSSVVRSHLKEESKELDDNDV